jgi:hypothetical protein
VDLQKLKRFEEKPKPVLILDQKLRIPFNASAEAKIAAAKIIRHIEKGEAVPEEYYRSGIDDPNSRDTMLAQYGIMHLHVYPGSKEIILFMQFDDAVIYFGINDHRAFDQRGGVKAMGGVLEFQGQRLAKAVEKARAAAPPADGQAQTALPDQGAATEPDIDPPGI